MFYTILIFLYQGNQTRSQKQNNMVVMVSNNIMEEYKMISNKTKNRGMVEFIIEE
jgi:hypothetical protein